MLGLLLLVVISTPSITGNFFSEVYKSVICQWLDGISLLIFRALFVNSPLSSLNSNICPTNSVECLTLWIPFLPKILIIELLTFSTLNFKTYLSRVIRVIGLCLVFVFCELFFIFIFNGIIPRHSCLNNISFQLKSVWENFFLVGEALNSHSHFKYFLKLKVRVLLVFVFAVTFSVLHSGHCFQVIR